MRGTCNRQRGAAMPMALLVVCAVGAMVAAMADGNRRQVRSGVHERAKAIVRQAADAGVSRAAWAWDRDRGYSGEDVRLGAADLAIAVEPATTEAGGARVRVCARSWPHGRSAPPVQVTVRATLRARATGALVTGWGSDER